jgi:hypothetical protein
MGEVLGVARKLGDTFSTGLDSLGGKKSKKKNVWSPNIP